MRGHFVLRTSPALRTANALRTEYQYTGLRTGVPEGRFGGAWSDDSLSPLPHCRSALAVPPAVGATQQSSGYSPTQYAVRSQYAAPETYEVRSAQGTQHAVRSYLEHAVPSTKCRRLVDGCVADSPAGLVDGLEELGEIVDDEECVLEPIDLEWLGDDRVE